MFSLFFIHEASDGAPLSDRHAVMEVACGGTGAATDCRGRREAALRGIYATISS